MSIQGLPKRPNPPTPRRLFVAASGACCLALLGCQSAPQPKSATAPKSPSRLKDEQLQVLRQAGFRETDDGWELGLSVKILFDLNNARVNESSREAIVKLGRQLRAVQILKLRVDGHTDNSGTRAHNEQLSLRRAEAVGDALTLAGYAATELQLRGLGAQFPVADNSTPEGRADNRRVAIVVPALP